MDRGGTGPCATRRGVTVLLLGCVAAALVLAAACHPRRALPGAQIPAMRTALPVGRWPTPPVAGRFDYPLQPREAYGPYVQGITGRRAIDTRFGAQNPALGSRSNCFRNSAGQTVPFSQLYHGGVDLFALGAARQLLWGNAADDPVHAVADGTVAVTLDAGAEGRILITQHRLPDQSSVYAVYWHVDRLQVGPGQPVERGQVVASVLNQGLNSHLHWEMRTFLDGSSLFPAGTAGARGTCNGHVAAVGYSWDDALERARPEFYGYLDPLAFVAAHQ